MKPSYDNPDLYSSLDDYWRMMHEIYNCKAVCKSKETRMSKSVHPISKLHQKALKSKFKNELINPQETKQEGENQQ